MRPPARAAFAAACAQRLLVSAQARQSVPAPVEALAADGIQLAWQYALGARVEREQLSRSYEALASAATDDEDADAPGAGVRVNLLALSAYAVAAALDESADVLDWVNQRVLEVLDSDMEDARPSTTGDEAGRKIEFAWFWDRPEVQVEVQREERDLSELTRDASPSTVEQVRSRTLLEGMLLG